MSMSVQQSSSCRVRSRRASLDSRAEVRGCDGALPELHGIALQHHRALQQHDDVIRKRAARASCRARYGCNRSVPVERRSKRASSTRNVPSYLHNGQLRVRVATDDNIAGTAFRVGQAAARISDLQLAEVIAID